MNREEHSPTPKTAMEIFLISTDLEVQIRIHGGSGSQ